ncbi:MAG: lysophospholipid acyltransferase family protein [Bacteroidota bacterium]
MIKKIWYNFLKAYFHIGFSFYYKKIIVKGKKNIPKNKAVLFVANHPNALIDPLLVAVTDDRNTHYLTRASVFNNPFIKKILFSVNMIPVFRFRDGISNEKLKLENEKIFEYCYDLLIKEQAILIFAEGSHNIQRRIRPFRKGFARIVFGAFDKEKSIEIDIVPVGLNYTKPEAYASSVSIIYGKPIAVKPYWEMENRNEATKQITVKVSEELKKITNHIEDIGNYDKIVNQFETDEFLDPVKVNKKLEGIDPNTSLTYIPEPKNKFNPLLFLVKLNSLIPLLIWNFIQPKIDEKEFISTFKFTVGITAFPIFYFIQKGIVTYFFGDTIGWAYLILSFASVFVLTKTKK